LTKICLALKTFTLRLISFSTSQRENRSLVCDVFESASRGAAAAFIASSTNQVNNPVPQHASQAVVPKQHHHRPQQQQQQQTSNMLVYCALACIYELACRHWKMVGFSFM
jgi:hypothetical protein